MIAAAMIVRNEEAFLAGCLDRLRALVDEIVVVDTGSTDRTRDIAAASGVRPFDFLWTDDFSAARNYALDQATADWILYIDADERLRPYDRGTLEKELADPTLCAATVPFHPRTGFTAYYEYRLFRRDPRIRFRGAIHETVEPDIQRLVTTGAARIGACGLTIDHLGYDGDQSAKLDRNFRLLLKELGADPKRLYLWWHLGTVYRDMGRLNEAISAWSRGIDLARQGAQDRPDRVLCFIEMCKLRLDRGEPAMELLREAIALQPDNLFLEWLEARALVASGNSAEAAAKFERLASVDSDNLVSDISYDRRILGIDAYAEAGHCTFAAGHYNESAEWFRRADLLAPDRPEFAIKRRLAGERAKRAAAGAADNTTSSAKTAAPRGG